MKDMGVKLNGKEAGDKVMQRAKKYQAAIVQSVEKAAKEVQTRIKNDGDKNIKAGGKFGARWTNAWQVTSTAKGVDAEIRARHAIWYAGVFEYGAVIHGKPMLWIPLSYTNVKVRARDYPGGLFRVKRKRDGLELLLSRSSKKPIYFGKRRVRIPKKWSLRRITSENAMRFKAIYRREFRSRYRG